MRTDDAVRTFPDTVIGMMSCISIPSTFIYLFIYLDVINHSVLYNSMLEINWKTIVGCC